MFSECKGSEGSLPQGDDEAEPADDVREDEELVGVGPDEAQRGEEDQRDGHKSDEAGALRE